MHSFWLDYGLFAAKVITALVLLGALLMVVATLLSLRQRERESIEIEKLNDKFESMQDALESELLSKAEMKSLRKQRKKEEKLENKALQKRLKDGDEEPGKPRVFVLRFLGDMHASEVESLRESITAVLSVAKKEDEVCVILDSAGGIVHNYGLAASQLARIRQKNIPLVVSIDLIAASGGYLMAAVANKIIAAPFAIVGSIGVRAELPNFHRFLKKHDIDIEHHTAGEYKTTLTMLGENTDKARKKFREELEEAHDLFKQYITDYRPQLDIEKLATGEYWYGTHAITLKMIDELLTSDDYLLAKAEAHDIFEVNYVINETLSDKVSTFLNGILSQVFQGVFKTPLK